MAVLLFSWLINLYAQTTPVSVSLETIEKSIEEFEDLKPDATPKFEDTLFSLVKKISTELELRENYCREEKKNQECFRDLIKIKRKSIEVFYDMKKRYAIFLHQQQLTLLDEAKNFHLKKIEDQF